MRFFKKAWRLTDGSTGNRIGEFIVIMLCFIPALLLCMVIELFLRLTEKSSK